MPPLAGSSLPRPTTYEIHLPGAFLTLAELMSKRPRLHAFVPSGLPNCATSKSVSEAALARIIHAGVHKRGLAPSQVGSVNRVMGFNSVPVPLCERRIVLRRR